MLNSKDILKDFEPNESCDEHSRLNGVGFIENSVIISFNEYVIKFCIFEVALILKRVPR